MACKEDHDVYTCRTALQMRIGTQCSRLWGRKLGDVQSNVYLFVVELIALMVEMKVRGSSKKRGLPDHASMLT